MRRLKCAATGVTWSKDKSEPGTSLATSFEVPAGCVDFAAQRALLSARSQESIPMGRKSSFPLDLY